MADDLTVLHLADIINERELRYEQRFQAQEAAIGVAKMEADTKYKDEQMRKARATILAVITLGIATGGLLIELLP